MDKLKMHTPDMTQNNIARIRELFPNCVTEAKDRDGNIALAVDFDALRQELSNCIVEGERERYRLDWPGKKEAMLAANAPIAKTLRPFREESVDFDTTQNLFIEGDNLDALKLLQESYLGKVKMIYIDPPYNRKKGNDLIYRDDFIENTYEYLTISNQYDKEGNKLIANTDANGRFHSDWLSMMYKRLKIAKNILSQNGIIIISIDDSETANIIKLCNDIYGEDNFVGTIIWKNATDNNPTNIAVEHESIHVYAKCKGNLESVWKSKISDIKSVLDKIENLLIEKNKGDLHRLQDDYSKWYRENKYQLGPLDRYKYIDFDGIYTGSQSVHNPGREGYRYDVIHPKTKKPCKQPLMGYRFPKETMDRLLLEKRILFGEDETKIIELKVYASEYEDKLSSVFELDGRLGAYDLKNIFPECKKVFSNPKPVQLMKKLIYFTLGKSDICIDLFAGSSTLAQAILEINKEDNGNRRFISIQYPEKIMENSAVGKDIILFCRQKGVRPVISEISKERIRRVGKKIQEELAAKETGASSTGQGSLLNVAKPAASSLDTGFRVLKVDSSNMNDVFYTPDAVKQKTIMEAISSVKYDRSDEDLLFQVLLDWGVDLSLPIRREKMQGRDVYLVDENALVACFDKNITEELVQELAELQPLRVVFRDDGFASDAVKINVDQIFRQISPGTLVKSL